jgi:hypothetical protein
MTRFLWRYPLFADALLNGNISATRMPPAIGDFTRKTREKPSAALPMSYATRKRLRPRKTLTSDPEVPID